MDPKLPNHGLPVGWFSADEREAARLFAELQRELPPGHALYQLAVRVCAHRDGASDDILVQHIGESDRYTVVHLSWLGKTEKNEQYPTVEFVGTFREFVKQEERAWGLKPPDKIS